MFDLKVVMHVQLMNSVLTNTRKQHFVIKKSYQGRVKGKIFLS